MSSNVRVTVVIPTFQRCDSVRRALAALAQQTLPAADYEVIVSIDGSNDGTSEMIATLPTAFHLCGLWNPNRGRAAACNAGAKEAGGDLLVLLDDDMEPGPRFLASHVRMHESAPHLGVIGAVPIAIEPSSPALVRYIGAKFNHHLERLEVLGQPPGLRDFYSGNFSIMRADFLAVGGFDEAFMVYGNEDLELSLRLTQAGIRLVYSPEALAAQHYDKTFPALARDTISKGRTAVLLAEKHPLSARDSRLATYAHCSRKWHLLRAILLKLTSWWPQLPQRIGTLVQIAENRQSPSLPLVYDLVLDYLFWVGVRAARRESGIAGTPVRENQA